MSDCASRRAASQFLAEMVYKKGLDRRQPRKEFRATVSIGRWPLLVLAVSGLALTLALVTVLYLHHDQGSGQIVALGNLQASLSQTPKVALSTDEKAALLATREGAKVKRDLYASFAKRWGEPAVFYGNAFNEQNSP